VEEIVSRKKNNDGRTRYISLNLTDDPEIAQHIDQWMVSYGLDSRSQTLKVMIKTAVSAVPMDTMIFEIAQAAVKQSRMTEYDALREFYEGRARLFGASR
jgi:hypothetical protein